MQKWTNSILRIVTTVVVTSLVVAPLSYATAGKDFRAKNDVIIYDPDAKKCGDGSNTPLTTEQKIGQILNVGFDSSSIGNLKATAQKYQLGGVYLNIQDPSKLPKKDIDEINKSMKSQLIVATDDEGGQIYRMLPKGAEPSAKQLGKMSNSQVLAAGKDTGTRLNKLGITTVLGPVLDIDTGLQNAISPYDRSFSSNPDTIADKAGAWADGVISQKVGVTFKHFPGIGSNTGNTDTTYVVMPNSKSNIDQFKQDLIPYTKLGNKTGAAVMLANFVLPSWGSDPVSINPKSVTYLRNTIGFKGLVTTDDLAVMGKSGYGSHKLDLTQSIVKALKAKVDMPLFAFPGDAAMNDIVKAVKDDVDVSVIDAAYANVIAYKTSLGLNTTPPASSTGGTASVVTGGDNRTKIWNFLISTKFKGYGDKAFGPVQAAGAIGNFFQESGWRFDAVEGNGEGHGIAQWSYGRKTTLFSLASSMGKKWSDPEVQFKMMQNELDGSYGKTLLEKGYDKLTDPKAAAYMFEQVYESAGIPAQKNRDDAAVKALKDLAGIAPGAGFSAGCTDATTNGTFNTSKATFKADDGFPIYIQTDPRWTNAPYGSSQVGPSGCGPSAMAMIITALTGQPVTPDQTAKKAGDDGMYISGEGSSHDVAPDLAKHYGLKATRIKFDVTSISNAIKSGSYVILSGKGALPFTKGGHYIMIRGVTADGKWKIGDSAHRDTNNQTFNPSTILSMASEDSMYAISK
jgi:beta-glucosidase-like glycosyl hydrolase